MSRRVEKTLFAVVVDSEGESKSTDQCCGMCENRVSQLPPWAQNGIASLKQQIQAWKELSESAMALVKEKDKEIERLQANQGSKEGAASSPDTKQGPPSPAGTSATETKEQTKLMKTFSKKLQKRTVVLGTSARDVLYDYAMRVNEILMDIRDEKGNIDPSFETQLLPEFIANLPLFAVEKWNEHVRKLPEDPSLVEFGRWILHEVEDVRSLFNFITPCVVCGIDYLCLTLEYCMTFKKMNVQARWKVVRKNNLCRLCLKNHLGRRCTYEMRCAKQGCQKNHHSMLHQSP